MTRHGTTTARKAQQKDKRGFPAYIGSVPSRPRKIQSLVFSSRLGVGLVVGVGVDVGLFGLGLGLGLGADLGLELGIGCLCWSCFVVLVFLVKDRDLCWSGLYQDLDLVLALVLVFSLLRCVIAFVLFLTLTLALVFAWSRNL
jgi:hypothetical protein